MFKKAKWYPLSNYTWAGNTDYIVFVKIQKNGMLKFKTKRVLSWWANRDSFVPRDLIDIKAQWETVVYNLNLIYEQ